MKKTKTALLHSATALLLCISMLIGSTFAWFSDEVTSSKNIITAGNLDLEMYWTDDLDSGKWFNVEDDGHNTIFSYDNWEPGYTDVKYIKLVNAGDLALNYELTLTPKNGVGKLAEVINVYFAEGAVNLEKRSDLSNLKAIGLLDSVLNGGATADGTLLAANQISPLHPSGEVIMTVAMNMLTTAGNDYQNEDAGKFTITALATQAPFEKDSFGSDYDTDAKLPTILTGGSASATVTPAEGKVPAGGVTLNGGSISAFVPEGVVLDDGATELTLTITPLENTTSDITVVNNEILIPVDVHIDGVAEDNTVPIIIDLGEVLPKYMNMGNYHLFHVEDGENVAMTLVDSKEALTAHNQFTYDTYTGAVSVAMATFSEVAMLADTSCVWEGGTADSWYDESATELTIANGDQLNAFSRQVGSGNNFKDKTITLLADINLNGNEQIFYPIGYYNNQNIYDRDDATTVVGEVVSSVSSFSGTFNGNGHTISNFYQNTWEMFGDYNDGYTGTPNYYKDAMGLFGYVYGGTIENLTVNNFSSDGEFTPTGVIAAYAVDSTFENIAITNCNPRVYNTGNGGIVGIGGNSDDTSDKKLTFTNITIDNTNKVSALWGSWDVACGGLMGMFRGNSEVNFTNCHVAAQIDVYNDVCGNYQYYWYRYSGMMIGSIRGKNITDKNGYIVPDTTGITAENCTVHFGEWNDYYYCELVANSLASYTHDHQFSRLTEIASLDEIKSGDTWIKAGNFLLISGDTKTCYHIVNDNGTLKQHLHTDAGEETVNGETVLKEDKQIVYLPFNQLFQGDGWGVKNIPVYNGDDYAFDGITILDREVADSVEKFEAVAGDSYTTGTTVTIGKLFKANTIEDNKLTIKPENVQVTVSPVGEGSTAGGTYTANAGDWRQGTLTFSGLGTATVTITDYYFCTPTTITITVTEPDSVDKFDVAFDHDGDATNGNQNYVDRYLYRVGNANTVALGSLFEAKDGATINASGVGVTIEKLDESFNVGGTFTPNTSEWNKGTIQFSGTGVVKVTITDDDYCIPTDLYLEVVDAKNITTASSSTNGTDVVLLNDVTIATDGAVHYINSTVYGNGFTFDVRDGMNKYNSAQGHGIIIINGVILDNLVILGDVYDAYGAYSTQEDYTSAIDATNSIIQNCHISNCSAPIRANGVTITNTTLYGGTVANLIISGGTNTLENVTTVNYNDNRGVIGFGIVISDGANENVKLVLNGELKQYNFVSADDVNSVPDDNAKKLFNAMFDDAYSAYHFETDPIYVNPGILSMVSTFDASDITNNTGNGYTGTTVSYNAGLVTATGYLYSIPASGNSVDNGYIAENDTHKATVQGDYMPRFEFDLGEQEISNDGADDTRYLVGDASGVEALYQNNESPITLDLTKLATVHKYDGINYNTSVSYKDTNGNTLGTDTTVSLTSSGTLEFAVTDDVFYDANGSKVKKSVERIYSVPITVSVKQAAIKNAVLTISKTSLNGTYTAAGTFDTSQYLSFNPLDAITVTDYEANGTGTTVDLTTNISTTTVDYVNSTSGAWGGATITITYTDGRVLTIVLGSTSMNSPGASNGGKTITVTNGTVKSDGKVAKSSATGGTWPITSYSFKGNNGSTVSPTESKTVTVTFADSSGCVTGDTLVMLADGTQKRIDEVTYTDSLMVWNFFAGEYDTAPASIIFYHGDDMYRVINLNFADGTTVKAINVHGFFDAESNKFVFIDEGNVASYVGHEFVKHTADGYETVELVGYSITKEYTGCYSIQSAMHNNFITEGMFSLTIPPYEGWFDYFEIGDKMKYDEAQMQADIEKYGLYTYEDFDEYVTYEQFMAFSGPYLKVLVGRGVVTYEQIILLIETYVPQ